MGYHYLPKFYLRGFCDPNDSDMICRYQKGSSQVLRTSLNNVAQETGFYSDDTEAYLSEAVEGPANLVISKIRNRHALDQRERSLLAEYIVVMLKRVPKGRERARAWFDSNQASYFAEVDSEIENLIAAHPERTQYLRSIQDELRRIQSEKRIKPDTIWENQLPPQWTPSVLDAIPRMNWQFFVTKGDASFLTSDNPVFFFESIGIGNEQSELTFPISSSVALWASWRQDLPQGFFNAKRQAVLEFNRRIVSNATQYVFHREIDQKIIELVNKSLRLNRIV